MTVVKRAKTKSTSLERLKAAGAVGYGEHVPTDEEPPPYTPEEIAARQRKTTQIGRPPQGAAQRVGHYVDPEDLKTTRYGLRMHPDLRMEIERAARVDGLRLSQWLERLMVTEINKRSGAEILDWIGRYKSRR